jgi:hypothetical protein
MLPRSEWELEKQELYGGGGLRAHMLQRGLPAKQAPPNWALDLFGRVLIAALRPNVDKACKFVYPNRPEAADSRLVDNIVRDSKDPGGYSVIAAGAKLPVCRCSRHGERRACMRACVAEAVGRRASRVRAHSRRKRLSSRALRAPRHP